MWKVEKIVKKGDYLYAKVWEHPKATKNGYVLLHRVRMENHLGRLLKPTEIVHHKDGNKKNNKLSNLEVMHLRVHARLHMEERGKSFVTLKCPKCKVEFEIPTNQSFLQKGSKATFCSRSCSAKFYRKVQSLGKITTRMKRAVSENLVLGPYKLKRQPRGNH